MATADKERQVIHRAARVLDEIESRIHELREELEANGMASPKRGRKRADDDANHDEDHDSHAQGRGGKGKAGDENLHGAAKAAHDAKAGDHGDDHGDQAKGRGKGKADDENLHGAAKAAHEAKAGDHDDHNKGRAKADAKHDDGGHDDDDRQPHGQGRVKHPETDKRLKGHKDDDDARSEKAEPAHKG